MRKRTKKASPIRYCDFDAIEHEIWLSEYDAKEYEILAKMARDRALMAFWPATRRAHIEAARGYDSKAEAARRRAERLTRALTPE